eukprot:TRINITY_DN44_c0_g1_i1.p1 TRINITY_DN44_c0_g1~~TRINITY_DN44_c0_g1_i1.p1  ORF type:complete len:290 (+),score=75.16 TRINITY_DN44_c0_g1_i1:118-987(+)
MLLPSFLVAVLLEAVVSTQSTGHKRRHTGARRVPIRKKRKFELGRQPANTKLGERKVHEVRVRGGNKKFRALKLDTGNWSWPSEACTRKARILTVVYNATSNELVRTNTLVKGAIVQIDCTPFKAWYLKYYGVHLGKVKKDEPQKTTEKPAKGAEVSSGKKGKKQESVKEEPQKTAPVAKDESGKKGKKKESHGKKEKTEEKGTQKTEEKGEKTDDKSQVVITASQLKKQAERNKTRQLETHLADQFNTGRLYARITSRPGQVGRCDGYVLEGEELAFYLRKLNLKKKK